MLILIAGAIIAVGGWFAQNAYEDMTNNNRETRIRAIYDSLKLGKEYTVTSEDIFGDRRPYLNDETRTKSSQRTYVHSADVDITAAAVRNYIEKAGFAFVNEPYPTLAGVQYHFKNDKNEYIRLNVSSKVRDEALRDQSNPQSEDYSIDPYDGPSNVLIKVNLDDNNE